MNLANRLTLLRIMMVPFLILFMYHNNFWMRIAALLLFVAAAITDTIDGIIARRNKMVTIMGTFLDPLADKLIVSAALITFVGLKELNIPAWMIVLIISREFIITGLRSLAATRGIIIAAHKSGKFKTTSQMTSIIALMLILIINAGLWKYSWTTAGNLLTLTGWNYALGWILVKLPFWLMLGTTILTVYSGLTYLHTHRDILKE